MKRVALIGFGAIGRSIAERLVHVPLRGIELVSVLMRSQQLAAGARALPGGVRMTDSVDEMMRSNPDVVVEAAGHGAIAAYGAEVLRAGRELFVLSTGALADRELADRLTGAAVSGGGCVVIPSGALAGFDGLLALREVGLTSVSYRSSKPVRAWLGTRAEHEFDLASLRHAVIVFSGSARQAALSFPKNANLAVAVALAGVGLEETHVELIADPSAESNVGEVIAIAQRARLELKLIGAGFDDNPKTSEITGRSVIAALSNRSAVVRYQ